MMCTWRKESLGQAKGINYRTKKAAPVLSEAAFVDRRSELSNFIHMDLTTLANYLMVGEEEP
ncbi:hypothetical protein DXT99_04960 [Pontibacter diazotrophicus]|uniref:Uncharacterized protein n=1 Tax=Pontibacter diazotrophicus TaxID=1400979 RepID=A0A3D8LGL6_9BACT|nr:hypothetical protein DXT99_04960 [Pontibacter diazotrophicus]